LTARSWSTEAEVWTSICSDDGLLRSRQDPRNGREHLPRIDQRQRDSRVANARSLRRQCLTHQANELLVIHRFSEDRTRASRSRVSSQFVIPVGRNEDDRDLETPGDHLLLHLKTAHFRHRNVENHATDCVQSVRPQKLLPRCERLDLEREDPQKPLERGAEALIVVDDGDDANVTPADRIAETLAA
jgi:hypothetical protein